MKLIDLTGKKMSQWLVIKRHPENYRKAFAQWVCRCDCGTERTVLANSLLTGKSSGCGCVKRQEMSRKQTKHGHSKRGCETATYRVWKHMHQRCYNTRSKDYKYYGKRGITVCERWHSYENFLEDMGERPSGLSIDRKDNDGNYTKTNCRWTTMAVQNANKRGQELSA